MVATVTATVIIIVAAILTVSSRRKSMSSAGVDADASTFGIVEPGEERVTCTAVILVHEPSSSSPLLNNDSA